jgi:hypothetical protein
LFPSCQPGPNQSLVFRESGENTKDDGDAGIELNAHEAVGDGIGDVLEVHGFAFDQDADGDHRVEGLGWHRCDHYAVEGWSPLEVEVGAGVVVREGKGEPKVSPPRRSVAVAPAWTREPVITLSKRSQTLSGFRS